MSAFALCVLGQAWTAHAKTAFVLPLPCQSCKEKERQEECKQRRMLQPSSFPVFFRAFCTVKLCQRNADDGGRCRRQTLFFLLFYCTSPSIFFCLFRMVFYHISCFQISLSTCDDSSQRSQHSVEVHLQQGTHNTSVTLTTFPIPSFQPSDPEPPFLFQPSCFLPLVVVS